MRFPLSGPPEGALPVATTVIEPEATNWIRHYDFDAARTRWKSTTLKGCSGSGPLPPTSRRSVTNVTGLGR